VQGGRVGPEPMSALPASCHGGSLIGTPPPLES
jgi:hypothetical protein